MRVEDIFKLYDAKDFELQHVIQELTEQSLPRLVSFDVCDDQGVAGNWRIVMRSELCIAVLTGAVGKQSNIGADVFGGGQIQAAHAVLGAGDFNQALLDLLGHIDGTLRGGFCRCFRHGVTA